ncbi:ROK family transcriptional regulator [Streptomyces sp. TRM 70351]|uniref:ROK family transcriptional regulator n=1 Tax=Streptomyces sp. TRM 70351 TaxID=3116552 RepID=UPI002E7AB96D|nr:ROK family transcriptional regulator [Streptomyces sp. TRM 70351]MEE1927209.1 ROK family transcriptional regulator [Streptomyces sp. TRM 70351]
MTTAPRPHTQADLRRRNLAAVLHAVAGGGPASRAAVAGRIGLTRAAVSTLVDELLGAGLLVEQGPGRSGAVGRPGTVLALSDSGPCGLGAEIGVDHLAVCAVDLRGRVRARVAVDSANRDSEPGPVLARLAELVRLVTGRVGAAGLRPAGLCVAVPGLVARDAPTVVRSPNLGWGLTRLDSLAGRLGTADGTLPVGADNEANLGALAELWLGGHEPAPLDVLHVSAEIGIGAAVLVGGRLLRGERGFAGELGHVPVRPRGRACGCGGRGCLEQYAGEEAVLRAAGLDPARVAAERPGPGARVGLLAERAAAGDRTVLRVLRSAGADLGVALTGAVSLLDPQAVVLGGALARLAPWLLPAAEQELDRRMTGRPGVLVSRLGPDGPLLGAAHSVIRAVLDDPPTGRR